MLFGTDDGEGDLVIDDMMLPCVKFSYMLFLVDPLARRKNGWCTLSYDPVIRD